MPSFLSWRSHASLPLLFVFLLALTCTGAARAAPVFAPSDHNMHSLIPYLDILEDPDGVLSVQDVATADTGAWRPLSAIQHAEFTHKTYWVRVTVDFRNFTEPQSFFRKEYHHEGSFRLFSKSGTDFTSVGTDEALPIDGRSIAVSDYLYKIATPQARTGTYYFRFEPRGHFARFDLWWSGSKGLIEGTARHQFWVGLFYGSLLVMWFYNAFLYAYTRNRAYLFYIYYLGCFIAVFVDLNGYSSLIFRLGPEYGKFFVIAVYCALHGISLFARHFLSLANTLPAFDAYLKHAQWALLCGALTALVLPVGAAYRVSVFGLLAVIPAVLAAGILRWRQGYEPARIFSLGWSVFCLAGIAYSLQLLGFLPPAIVTTYGMQAGSVMEAVFFSLALGYQIKLADRKAAIAKNAFLCMISHELRTPLQTIVSSIDLLSVRKSAETRDSAVIDRLGVAADHLEMQMRDLTDYARLDSSKLQLRYTAFNVSRLIEAVAAEFRLVAQKNDLDFIADIEPCNIDIHSDSLRIQQIVNNLIVNAIKYTETGYVNLTLRYVYAPNNQLSLLITVADSGIGIDADAMPTLFDPFSQVDHSSTRRHDGIGMGLAIVHRLVTLFGGRIEVESTPGKGSRFSVILPVCEVHPASQQEDSAGNGNPRILLVDDTRDVCESLKEILEHLGYRCDIAACGQEAIRHTARQSYGAILLDINMPDMDGFCVANTIRGRPGINRNVPIIWISATGPQIISTEQRKLFSHFLEKPVHAKKLHAMLKEVLV